MADKNKKSRSGIWDKMFVATEFILILVMLVLIWKIANYLLDDFRSRAFSKNLELSAVIMEEAENPQKSNENQENGKTATETTFATENNNHVEQEIVIPSAIDFDRLHEISQDAIAWLYCPGTQINNVIAQSDDNDYYLRRLLNGSEANCGTLFADYRNGSDFSNEITLIYGHNMKNGTMFASLMDYRDPGYYEEHPVMYLYTPGKRYCLELIAGYTTDINDIVFEVPASKSDREAILAYADKASSFVSGVKVAPEDRLVILSTCSYAYDDARYVVIGRLIEEKW